MLYIYIIHNNYNIHHRDLMGLGKGVSTISYLVSTRFENERIKFIYMKYLYIIIQYLCTFAVMIANNLQETYKLHHRMINRKTRRYNMTKYLTIILRNGLIKHIIFIRIDSFF